MAKTSLERSPGCKKYTTCSLYLKYNGSSSYIHRMMDIPGLLSSECTVLCMYTIQNGPSDSSVMNL